MKSSSTPSWEADMSSTPQGYVPCLRWKMGEYQALLRLDKDILDAIVPLIEVAEIGYDFEKRTVCASIDDHLAPFAKRINDKLGRRSCFVDMKHISPTERMANGDHPATFVFDRLRAVGVPAIPTLHLRQDNDLYTSLATAMEKDRRGACLRMNLEETSRDDLWVRTDALLARVGLPPSQCDFILDLVAPNFMPIDGFTTLVVHVIAGLPHLAEWRSFTLVGTSFPATTAEIPRGLSTIDRNEWIAYKMLIAELAEKGLRLPRFGDYGIAHPAVTPMNPLYVKPNATVRYTVDNGWVIAKGTNVRDHKYGQFRGLCGAVLASGEFEGPDYSMGDRYIAACAAGEESTGNLSTWRWVGTNHHLTKVVRDISNLVGPSSSP